MPVRVETYEQVALEDGDAQWELVCGSLRRKPPMTFVHGGVIRELHLQLVRQLDAAAFVVDASSARLRVSTGSYYVPDLVVIARALTQRGRSEHPDRLEVYDEPMPLVVEVWSPSTGEYDVETKLQEYQRRGDREIWRIHPYERTLTAWQRQPDGTYTEVLHRDGVVQPASLPAVRIDLAWLFA